MTNTEHPHPGPRPTTAEPGAATPDPPGVTDVAGVELAVFDPALHAAAVAEQLPEASLMPAGWWSAVTAPEDPRTLELRHIPDLPAADARRIVELFAEVVDAGRACTGDAWEVLTLWERGTSPSATAAAQAVLILISRGAEAEVAADLAAGLVPAAGERARARLRDALGFDPLP